MRPSLPGIDNWGASPAHVNHGLDAVARAIAEAVRTKSLREIMGFLPECVAEIVFPKSEISLFPDRAERYETHSVT